MALDRIMKYQTLRTRNKRISPPTNPRLVGSPLVAAQERPPSLLIFPLDPIALAALLKMTRNRRRIPRVGSPSVLLLVERRKKRTSPAAHSPLVPLLAERRKMRASPAVRLVRPNPLLVASPLVVAQERPPSLLISPLDPIALVALLKMTRN